jgi:hypothetical protein
MQRLFEGFGPFSRLGMRRADDHRRVFAAFAGVLARLLPPARRTAGERR